MPSARGIVIEIIGDATSYLRAAETTIATNTKLDESLKSVAIASEQSAAAQVGAKAKVIEAQRAQVASLEAYTAKQIAGSKEAEAAALATSEAQLKLNRTLGLSSASTSRFGSATKTGERDLGKLTRGTLAGSGAVVGLGRSLAFASSGFLAFAAGATLISRSITSAEDLEKAQRSLGVAIQHTGGNVEKLTPIYTATAKAAAQFGVSEADATTGLARATVLTGNAAAAQRAYQEALVISKATGKDFNSVLIATSKGQEGITTSLRRYGILVDKTDSGTDQFTKVMQRFGGQAKANTTAVDKLHASFTNAEATIGEALLPTFNRLVTSLSAWLTKMQQSGKLQKDVNAVVHDAGAVFHTLGGAIHKVNEVTGSFLHTLEALAAIKFATMLTGWIDGLTILAAKWGLVGGAATTAGAAQTAALAESGAAGAAGAGAAVGGAEAGVAAGGLAIGLPEIIAIVAAVVADQRLQPQRESLKDKLGPLGFIASGPTDVIKGFVHATRNASDALQKLVGWEKNVTSGLRNLPAGEPALLPQPGGARFLTGPGGGGARPSPTVFKSFTDTVSNQLAQARAALTKSTKDDVAAAKAEIAFIKREIAAGHLQGASLIQGLQAEAGAVSTIQSALAAEAQKRAAQAQALKAKIQARIQDSIDPLKLEVQLSKDQADNAKKEKILRDLKALRAAARKALASGNLSLEQQKEAYDQITQLNSQIAAATKKNKEAQKKAGRDAYKQVNQAKFLGGLDLTPAQRKALRQRLAQLGPGGTVGSDRVGAYGYQIGDNGRPIHVHTQVNIDGQKVASNTTKHQQRRRRRNSSQRRGPVAGENG